MQHCYNSKTKQWQSAPNLTQENDKNSKLNCLKKTQIPCLNLKNKQKKQVSLYNNQHITQTCTFFFYCPTLFSNHMVVASPHPRSGGASKEKLVLKNPF
jgi:hypothetical protein